MTDAKSKCFTCQNQDKPELCVAYYKGYIKACEQFLSWAKAHNINEGSIADDDLGGLYARINYDYGETCYLLGETEKETTK